jgi:predicted ATP-grasp superfamily ATP-dependent carboligase
LNVARRIGRRAILIPTSDVTAAFVAENAPLLQDAFLFPHQSPALLRTLSRKKDMYLLCKRMGIPTAETVFPKSRAEVLQFSKNVQYPMVVKGIDGSLLERRAGTRIEIAKTEAELLEVYGRLEDPENPNLILQEYIPGGDDSVWMFNGYFNRHSECLAGFTGRKIRQFPVHRGATCLGICERNEVVEQDARLFLQRLAYQGIVDMGYRYDARDGQYKLLDVNPRVGCTFRLFVDKSGLDVVRALYLDLTGQPVQPAVCRDGRKWLVEDNDVGAFLSYRREGQLTLSEWLRSFRGVQEYAWFASDDQKPFWATCIRFLGQSFAGLSRWWKRLRQRLSRTLLPKDKVVPAESWPSRQA